MNATLRDVTVVPMVESDWPQVRAVHAEGIATGHATFEAQPAPTWDAFDAGRVPGHRLVARDGAGMVLGWAAVSLVSPRPVYAGVLEHSVHVAAAARGRAVGRRLLEGLIASTEAAGVWTLQSSIFPENTASLALHDRTGFRRVGVRERVGLMTHGPLAGTWRDTVLVERRRRVDPPTHRGARPVTTPRVLFVCVKNGGKSQMAAGLMRAAAGSAVQVDSAGTRAGDALNGQSVESLREVGVDISGGRPQQLTDEMVAAADLVVVLGSEARVEPVGGTPVEVWETDEPSTRGIEGAERMRLVRDDIAVRVEELARRLTPRP